MRCTIAAVRHALVATAAVAALALSGCAASSLAQRRWIEASTPDMVVLSDAKPEHAAALAHEIALFRQVLAHLVHVTPGERQALVRVIELDHPSDLARLTKSRMVAGLMTPRLEDNVALIGGSVGSREVLYHELVHVLLRESGAAYPQWYEEGIAEFLSTVRRNGNKIEIGRPPPRMGLLTLQARAHGNRAPETGTHLQSGVEGPDLDELYSTWWAMVSFLTLGHIAGAGEDRRPQLADFLAALSRGEKEDAAYAKAFGMTRKELEDRAVSFLGSMKVPVAWIEMPELVDPPKPKVSVASAEAIGCSLGEVAADIENADAARELFEVVARTSGESGCGIVGLERALVAQKSVDAAEQAVEARLARDPDDTGALIARAELLLRPMSRSGKPGAKVPPAQLAQARGLLRRVLAAHPDHLVANLRLASSYRVGEDDVAPAIAAIEKVLAVRTAAPEAYVTAGDLYLRSGDLRRAEIALQTAVRLRGHRVLSGEATALLSAVAGRKAAGPPVLEKREPGPP